MEKIVKNTNEWVDEMLNLINQKEYKQKMEEAGVKVVIKGAPDYPKNLMQYKEAPEFLFYRVEKCQKKLLGICRSQECK